MLEVKQLSIGYSALEDRLVVLTVGKAGEQTILLLTRRLTGALLNGLGMALRRFKTGTAVIPEEFRDGVVLMEHQEAVAAGTPPQTSKAGPESGGGIRSAAAVLVTEIKLTTHPSHFTAVFHHAETALASLLLSRQDAHRLLDTLKRHAEQAGWSLIITETWLSSEQTSWTIN